MRIDMKRVRHFLEFVPLATVLGFFRLLSPEHASDIAGKIGRMLGPKLAKNRKALAHLQLALPGKTDAEYNVIITGMWDHLARIVSEYLNLGYFAPKVELVGLEHLKAALEKQNGQVILFSGHIGNWEVMAPTLLKQGVALDLVYRPPNNPWSDQMLDRLRSMGGKLLTIPKSKSGTRLLVQRLQQGHSVGILIDQKYNEGLAVPFFGHPAMTSPAFVQLAQKFKCPLVPFRVERLAGAKFRLSIYEPMKITDENGNNRAYEDVIAEAHALLENWITERPEQWLWLHRRWIDQKNPGKRAAEKMAKAGMT